MAATTFREALAGLYPEIGGIGPDPDAYAESIVIRVLNAGSPHLREQMLAYYGAGRVRAIAQSRADRLDAPVYRAWKADLQLPDRAAAVDRLHALWRH
jgi:hypothetical protein